MSPDRASITWTYRNAKKTRFQVRLKVGSKMRVVTMRNKDLSLVGATVTWAHSGPVKGSVKVRAQQRVKVGKKSRWLTSGWSQPSRIVISAGHGVLVIPKTSPAMSVRLTPAGRTSATSVTTRSRTSRELRAGQYVLEYESPEGYEATVNGGAPTISISERQTVDLRVQLEKLASPSFVSLTSDGLQTRARVTAAVAGTLEVEFLNPWGAVGARQTVEVSRPGTESTVAVEGDFAVARIRPLGNSNEANWVTAGVQKTALTDTSPEVKVTDKRIKVTAAVSSEVVSVSRRDLGTGRTSPVEFDTSRANLSLAGKVQPSRTYEYTVTSVNDAGREIIDTITITSPDATGNGLSVLKPNLHSFTVSSIKFPNNDAEPVTIPVSSLPRNTNPTDLIGDPIIVATPDRRSAVVGRVLTATNAEIRIARSGPFSVFQDVQQKGFEEGAVAAAIVGPSLARKIALKCSYGGIEFTGPSVDYQFDPPTMDFDRWELRQDGLDLHLRGNAQATATLGISGLTARTGVDCYVDDLPMYAVVNIDIPAGPVVIPTVFTAKPFIEASASLEADLGSLSRTITVNLEFEISNGFNGPKLHTPNPITATMSSGSDALLSPRGVLSLRAGMDFAYGLGQGITSAGLQVSGLSLKAGPELSATFQTGLASGRPNTAACLNLSLKLATAQIEGHIVEAWLFGKNWSFSDAVFFDLPYTLTAFDEPLKCWGDTDQGSDNPNEPGDPDFPVPATGGVQVSAADDHSCAVLASGAVKCWGWGFAGELGNGKGGFGYKSNLPVTVLDIDNATQVSAGGEHSCAVLATGEVECWGSGGGCQMGNGNCDHRIYTRPVTVFGIGNATQVSAGRSHSCALLTTGKIKCWGHSGYLGNGSQSVTRVPVLVRGINNATQVSVGDDHSCAVLVTGEVKCWGLGRDGELGDGKSFWAYAPVTVLDIDNATQVSAGGHSCAVLVTGEVKCWGSGGRGQLGNGSNEDSDVPVKVRGIKNATHVSDRCAVLVTGEVKCWGWALGNGGNAASNVPTMVRGINNATQVSTGNGHSCATLSPGVVQCWGSNRHGQLGNGSNEDSNVPVTVRDLSTGA